MKKLILGFALIIFTLPSLRAEQKILHCLGMEELKLHQNKVTGPLYKLNQLFISELTGLNTISMKRQYLSPICKGNGYSPSVLLLRTLLLKGEKVFDLDYSDAANNFMISNVREFMRRTPHIFFNYISLLQSMTPTAGCLEKNIPEISHFITQYHYLEGELTTAQLLEDKGKIVKIFKKLKKLDKIIASCNKDAKKKKK